MKKILAVLLALIIIPLSMQTYNADESSETAPQSESSSESTEQTSELDEQKRLVALGDSITRGYGLAEDEKSYVEILTEEGNFKSNNFAVNGRTSTVLLEDLQKPSEKERSALEQANYIVMSIGGNDMLYLLNKLVNGALPSDSTENPVETVNNLIDMAEKLTAENMTSDISYYKSTVEKVINILREMNPNAEIVMQTVYNPFKPIFVVAPIMFANMKDDIDGAYKRVEGCINGFNTTLFELSEKYGFKIADVSKVFRESDKKYINMSLSNPDIHPNAAGHRCIAEIIEQTLDPDKTIFTFASVKSGNSESSNFDKLENSEKLSTNSEQSVENSEDNTSDSEEMSYTQRILIFVGVMAVVSFVITYTRLKRKSRK